MRRLIIIGLVLGSSAVLLDQVLRLFQQTMVSSGLAGSLSAAAMGFVIAIRTAHASNLLINAGRIIAIIGIIATLYTSMLDITHLLGTRGTNVGLGASTDLATTLRMLMRTMGVQIILLALLSTAFLARKTDDPVKPAEIFS